MPLRLCLLVCFFLCHHTSAADLRVSAASSLCDALDEIAGKYQEKTGNRVRLNYAASGTLARQIEHGAPTDVFISANEEPMQQLAERGLIDESTQSNLLSNSLILAVPKGNPAGVQTWYDLQDDKVKRVAIGLPEVVAAGTYAREALQQMGIWQKVTRKSLQSPSVRAALAAVAAGNADAGILYLSDARSSEAIAVVGPPPVKVGITYPSAVLAESKNPSNAKAFLTFLRGPVGKEVFERLGFIAVTPVSE